MTRTLQRLLVGGLLLAAPIAFADASVDGTPAQKPPVGRHREPAKPGRVRQPDPAPAEKPDKPEKVGKTRAPDPDFGDGAKIGTTRQVEPQRPLPPGTYRQVEPVPPRERKVGKVRAPEPPKEPEKPGTVQEAEPEHAPPPRSEDKPKYGPAPSGK